MYFICYFFIIFKSLDLTLPSNLLIHEPKNGEELMYYKILFKHCIIFPNYSYDLDYNKSLNESQFSDIKFYNFYLMAFDYYGYKLILLNKVKSFKTTYFNVSLPYGYIANKKENNPSGITLDDYIELIKNGRLDVLVNNNSDDIVNEFIGEDKDILIDPIDKQIKENVSKKIDVIVVDENETLNNTLNEALNENGDKLNNSIKLIDNTIIPLDKENESNKIKKNAGYLDDKFKSLFKQDKVNKNKVNKRKKKDRYPIDEYTKVNTLPFNVIKRKKIDNGNENVNEQLKDDLQIKVNKVDNFEKDNNNQIMNDNSNNVTINKSKKIQKPTSNYYESFYKLPYSPNDFILDKDNGKIDLIKSNLIIYDYKNNKSIMIYCYINFIKNDLVIYLNYNNSFIPLYNNGQKNFEFYSAN